MTHCYYNCSGSHLPDKHLGIENAEVRVILFHECNTERSEVKEKCALLLNNCVCYLEKLAQKSRRKELQDEV